MSETKKYIVNGNLLLGNRFILPFEMKYDCQEDVPLWAKDLGWNFDRPSEEMICITDTDNNEWIIETSKIIAWKVNIDEE